MIVLTGYGRSGTSLLALLYRELGFDPGGTWNERMDAGLEDRAVWKLNDQIASRLGVAIPGSYHHTRLRQALARVTRRPARLYLQPPIRGFARYRTSRVDSLVAELGPQMRSLASERVVVKDPRMLWTLGVWLAAGASIEAVVISVRDIDEVAASRRRASLLNWPEAGIRTATAHGLLRAVDGVTRHQVPYAIVRYPELLDDPHRLHATLPFPEPVEFDRFDRALAVVRR
jgi:hypothetical protein